MARKPALISHSREREAQILANDGDNELQTFTL